MQELNAIIGVSDTGAADSLGNVIRGEICRVFWKEIGKWQVSR